MIDISSQKWLKQDISVLVAFSGGVDSRVLFDVLYSLKDEFKIKLYAFHLDHNLRSQSKEDADFVAKICSNHGIELFSYSLDIASISKEQKESIELTARKKRYELIDSLVRDKKIDYVATAHHSDDNVETFLLHLFRGSGMKGLSSMKECEGSIIRPLIRYSKSEIEDYASANGLEYVTDHTNYESDYSRNKIRNELIPLIEEQYSKNIKENIVKAIDAIRLDVELVDEIFSELYDFSKEKYELSNLKNKSYNHIKTFVLKLLEHRFSLVDVNSYQINLLTSLIINNDSGEIEINNVKFSIESGYLMLVINKDNTIEKKALMVGDNYYGDYRITISKGEYVDNKNTISIAESEIKGSLYARGREAGDRFRPSGMKGTKKLKNFFIDSKIRKSERDRVLIISDDIDIYWVYPYRKSERKVDYNGSFLNITVYKTR